MSVTGVPGSTQRMHDDVQSPTPLTEPVPVIVIDFRFAEVKWAVTGTNWLLEPACTTHVGDMPHDNGGFHPRNWAPLVGVAVNVISVGDDSVYEQLLVQVTPIGAA